VAVEITLAELCSRTGVTVRTVRYYVQQGLLPSPGTGPHARYGQVHLDRLQLIRRLQREHLPLAEIRRRIEAGLVEVLTSQPAGAGISSAAEYVKAVLAGLPPPPFSTSSGAGAATSAATSAAPTAKRETWERIAVSADVELHVRRPQARLDQRRIDRLIEAAQRIWSEPD